MKNLTMKYAAVGGLVIVLWIGAEMVRGLGHERRSRQSEASNSVAGVLTQQQRLGTPYVKVPMIEIIRDKGKEIRRTTTFTQIDAMTADFGATATVSERKRGIFAFQAYDLDLQGKIGFDYPAPSTLTGASSDVPGRELILQQPFFVLPLNATKALKEFPQLRIAGIDQPIQGKACAAGTGVLSGSQDSGNEGERGICFLPGLDYRQFAEKAKTVEISVKTSAMENLYFATTAEKTAFALESNWPSPSFQGEVLPAKREIREQGFTAAWDILKTSGVTGETIRLEVRFIDPIDRYTLIDRSTKHAILFIVCVFAGFFTVEVFRKARLHPLQYGLVGASLIVFYLLVLSLCEHIPFVWAYAISVALSVGLIRFYLGGVLARTLDANLFAVALTGLYGMLYTILSAEDFALLFGSSLVFALLAVTMIVTRKTDWFQVEREFTTGSNPSV